MKKIILIFLFVLSLCNAYAQSDSIDYNSIREMYSKQVGKYLTFKGIELKPGLLISELVNKLEEKGCIKSGFSDMFYDKFGGYELLGTFNGIKNTTIRILPTDNNNKVVGIINVEYPNYDSFKMLKDSYDDLKFSLKNKYSLQSSTENFYDEYINESTSDRMKLIALSRNEGEFKSRYYLDENPASLIMGQIILSISHLTVDYKTSYFVSLSYYTSDNVLEQLKNRTDDL